MSEGEQRNPVATMKVQDEAGTQDELPKLSSAQPLPHAREDCAALRIQLAPEKRATNAGLRREQRACSCLNQLEEGVE